MPRRWRWPPENSNGECAQRLRDAAQRVQAGPSPDRAVRRHDSVWKFSIGSVTICSADSRGLSEEYGSWNTICTRCRNGRIACSVERGDVGALDHDTPAARRHQTQDQLGRRSTCRSPIRRPCTVSRRRPRRTKHRRPRAPRPPYDAAARAVIGKRLGRSSTTSTGGDDVLTLRASHSRQQAAR